jgi:hypothetical protein
MEFVTVKKYSYPHLNANEQFYTEYRSSFNLIKIRPFFYSYIYTTRSLRRENDRHIVSASLSEAMPVFFRAAERPIFIPGERKN